MSFSLLPEQSKKLATASASKAITALKDRVSEDLDAVNAAIIERMQSPISLIPQLAGHLIASGGKRLRPLLTLGTADLIGYRGRRHIDLAAIVEFIHTATLLHDDVVDESALRRGKKTANAIWGNPASVLVGDFLFSRAFELMVKDGSLDVLAILSKASATISEGEILQLQVVGDVSVREQTYVEIITAKTAALFAAACEIAAVAADCPTEQRKAVRDYGLCLGIAFQIADDALDYIADQNALGKAVGDDFREGKMTLPVILAYQKGSEEEKTFWKRVMAASDQSKDDLSCALGLMEKHNTLKETDGRAKDYADRAKAALKIFPESEVRQILEGVADFAVARLN